MTDLQLTSQISKEFNLSARDASSLLEIALNGHQFEVVGEDSEKVNQAYQRTLELIPRLSIRESIQLAEPHVDLSDVIHRINSQSPEFSISESSLDVLNPTKEEFDEMLVRLCGAKRRVSAMKIMLDWAIADACNEYEARFGSMNEVLKKISGAFQISPFTLRMSCGVASKIPKDKRVKGWSWWHYRPIIKHYKELAGRKELMASLTEGVSKEESLECGATVSSRRPLSPRKIAEKIRVLTLTKSKRKSNKDRYIYITPHKVYVSDELYEGVISSVGVRVIDSKEKTLLRQGKHPQPLSEFDPSVSRFYESVLGRSRAS